VEAKTAAGVVSLGSVMGVVVLSHARVGGGGGQADIA
jgi:hypothetical protein